MPLGFLAVEGCVDIDVVVPRQGDGCRNGDGDALVRRSEQEVWKGRHGGDRGGIRDAHAVERGSAAQGAEIEEIGTAASGLEHEFAESEDVLAQQQFEKTIAVHHMPSARRCSWKRLSIPDSARASISASVPPENGSFSAVPCTSMKPPSSIMTTFMSVSAVESSA